MLLKVNEDNIRLDQFLAKSLKITRNKAQELIDLNLVFVNKFNRKNSFKLKENDIIDVLEKEETIQELSPLSLDLDIRYEDDDLLVLNKPNNLVVHPSLGHQNDTLVNALLYRIQLSTGSDKFRPGIVHRLDKDTSGLMIIAKNDFAHEKLSMALKKREVHRHYIALVNGNIKVDVATIKGKIGRDLKNRKKMAVNPNGKEAITHIKILKRYSNNTLVECILDTGRTHQIRVHLSTLGNPVVGDKLYCCTSKLYTSGQLLHAYKIAFRHPRTHELIEIESELPEYFLNVLERIKDQLID